MQKYIVIEIQMASDGTVATINTVCDNYSTAQQKYHTILAAAAVSDIQVHSAVILYPTGQELEHQGYDRSEQAANGA